MYRSCYGAASAGCNHERGGGLKAALVRAHRRRVTYPTSGVGRRRFPLEAQPTPVCPRIHGRARATYATLLQSKRPNIDETILSATLPQSRALRLGLDGQRTQAARNADA